MWGPFAETEREARRFGGAESTMDGRRRRILIGLLLISLLLLAALWLQFDGSRHVVKCFAEAVELRKRRRAPGVRIGIVRITIDGNGDAK